MDFKKGKSKSAKATDKTRKVIVEKQQWTEPKRKDSKKVPKTADDVSKKLFAEDGGSVRKTKRKSGRDLIKEMKRRKSLTLEMMKTGMKEISESAIDVTPKLIEWNKEQKQKQEQARRGSAKKTREKPSPKTFSKFNGKTSTPEAGTKTDTGDSEDLDNTIPFDSNESHNKSKAETDEDDVITYPKTPQLSVKGKHLKGNSIEKTPLPGTANRTPMPIGSEAWTDFTSTKKSKGLSKFEITPGIVNSGKRKEISKGTKREGSLDSSKKSKQEDGGVVIVDTLVQNKDEEKAKGEEGSTEQDIKGKRWKREEGEKRKRKKRDRSNLVLFCGNIPDHATFEYLKFYFAEADCFPQIRLKKEQRGGKNRPKKHNKSAILICKDEEEVGRLLDLDKAMIPSVKGGIERALQIHPLMNKADAKSGKKIFVTNIHNYVTKNELVKLFKDNGHKVVKCHHYSNRGQAYLWFYDIGQAKAAAKIKNKTLRGKEFKTKYCKARHQYGQTMVPEDES